MITSLFLQFKYKANVLLDQIKTIKKLLVMKKVFVKGLALAFIAGLSFTNISCDSQPQDTPATIEENLENAEANLDEATENLEDAATEAQEGAEEAIDTAVENLEDAAANVEAKVEEVTE